MSPRTASSSTFGRRSGLQTQYPQYEIQKVTSSLALRQKDQAFEQIIAPAAAGGGAGGSGHGGRRSDQTLA